MRLHGCLALRGAEYAVQNLWDVLRVQKQVQQHARLWKKRQLFDGVGVPDVIRLAHFFPSARDLLELGAVRQVIIEVESMSGSLEQVGLWLKVLVVRENKTPQVIFNVQQLQVNQVKTGLIDRRQPEDRIRRVVAGHHLFVSEDFSHQELVEHWQQQAVDVRVGQAAHDEGYKRRVDVSVLQGEEGAEQLLDGQEAVRAKELGLEPGDVDLIGILTRL